MGSTYSSFHTDTPRTLSTGLKAKVFLKNPTSIVGIFFFIFGCFFTTAFFSVADFKSAFVFSDDDPSVSCVLYDISSTGNKINKRVIYDYTYRYTVNKTGYEGHSFYTSKGYEAGDTLRARYKADKPQTSHIDGMGAAPFSFWVVCFTLIFPVTGLIFLITSTRKFLENIHLLTNGILTTGKVVRKEPTMTKINKQTVYKVYFQFKLPNNSVQEAYVKTHKTNNLGDEAQEPLVYDSLNPSSAVLLDTLPKQVRVLLTGEASF